LRGVPEGEFPALDSGLGVSFEGFAFTPLKGSDPCSKSMLKSSIDRGRCTAPEVTGRSELFGGWVR
jgi:hypothetical protein